MIIQVNSREKASRFWENYPEKYLYYLYFKRMKRFRKVEGVLIRRCNNMHRKNFSLMLVRRGRKVTQWEKGPAKIATKKIMEKTEYKLSLEGIKEITTHQRHHNTNWKSQNKEMWALTNKVPKRSIKVKMILTTHLFK